MTILVSKESLLNRSFEGPKGCWIWVGPVDKGGYGKVGKGQLVHRVAYELWKGTIPNGLDVDHLCFKRRCFNPSHLEAVTHIENVKRSTANQALEKATRLYRQTKEELHGQI